MKRRHFLALLSAGGTAISHVTPAFSAPAAPDRHRMQQVTQKMTRSIHAHFGSGFELRSTHVAQGRTVCVIENRGNRLRVSSRDATTWFVESATPM